MFDIISFSQDTTYVELFYNNKNVNFYEEQIHIEIKTDDTLYSYLLDSVNFITSTNFIGNINILVTYKNYSLHFSNFNTSFLSNLIIFKIESFDYNKKKSSKLLTKIYKKYYFYYYEIYPPPKLWKNNFKVLPTVLTSKKFKNKIK